MSPLQPVSSHLSSLDDLCTSYLPRLLLAGLKDPPSCFVTISSKVG